MKKSEKVQLISFGCGLVGMALAVVYSLNNKEDENQNEKLSLLEQYAEQDGNKGLSIIEESEMYKMCGVGDKPKNYVLTAEDVQRGIDAYELETKKGIYKNGN